jgi:hypothetical protein
MATAEVLNEGVTGADYSGGAQPFETVHGP